MRSNLRFIMSNVSPTSKTIAKDPRVYQSDHQNQTSNSKKRSVQYRCPVDGCDHSYSRRYDMKLHFLSKHKDQRDNHPEIINLKKSTKNGKKFLCPITKCECGYSRKADLKTHMLNKHPNECDNFPDILRSRSSKTDKKFLCPVKDCKCGYNRKFDLKMHMSTKHSLFLSDCESTERSEDHLIESPAVSGIPSTPSRPLSPTEIVNEYDGTSSLFQMFHISYFDTKIPTKQPN
eukprot:TRINITY_DN3348_c0_g3_i1.p1 TRINITY_DN3348_c0_g3~~TRINITY_DN3348_c0_g3_i1.p1  ORF type:complete len:233 (+),score=15.87 TRINITY_DN3348_c0_g3_i1:79-777(+)